MLNYIVEVVNSLLGILYLLSNAWLMVVPLSSQIKNLMIHIVLYLQFYIAWQYTAG